MVDSHREIRAKLKTMSPKRAVALIRSFELPEDEEACLIECDVRRKSYAQVCASLNLSPETVKRNRRRAFAKMEDALVNSPYSPAGGGGVQTNNTTYSPTGGG